METITTVNAELDEKEMEIRKTCLGIPTVLRHVLIHFHTKELIQLSLVNKLWNFEARSVMKERGDLRANISSKDDNICQQLTAFGSALENMRVIPFSGIHLSIHHPCASQLISDSSVSTVFLHRLPLKHFSVSFDGEWKQCENCFALQVVTTILADFCGVLEELSLLEGRYEFYQDILEDRRLPCLKTLKVKPGEFYKTNEPLTSAFIKGLVARAPNLWELHVDGAINFKENFLRRSSAVLVPTRPLRPLVEQVCDGLINSLSVSAMEIVSEKEELDPELLNWFLPLVLAVSHCTLKILLIHQRFVKPFASYGLCFPNVTHVFIRLNSVFENIDPAVIEAAVSELPKGIELKFPKIKIYAMFTAGGRSYLWLCQTKTFPFNYNNNNNGLLLI